MKRFCKYFFFNLKDIHFIILKGLTFLNDFITNNTRNSKVYAFSFQAKHTGSNPDDTKFLFAINYLQHHNYDLYRLISPYTEIARLKGNCVGEEKKEICLWRVWKIRLLSWFSLENCLIGFRFKGFVLELHGFWYLASMKFVVTGVLVWFW